MPRAKSRRGWIPSDTEFSGKPVTNLSELWIRPLGQQQPGGCPSALEVSELWSCAGGVR